jgi:hypothetical protein
VSYLEGSRRCQRLWSDFGDLRGRLCLVHSAYEVVGKPGGPDHDTDEDQEPEIANHTDVDQHRRGSRTLILLGRSPCHIIPTWRALPARGHSTSGYYQCRMFAG